MTDEKYIPLSQVVHAFERLQNLKEYNQDLLNKEPRDIFSHARMGAYDNAMDILLGSIPLLSKEVSE